MTDRKLHVDTLILIHTLKIYVFWYFGRTDGQTDREINPVWAFLTTFLQVNSLTAKSVLAGEKLVATYSIST